MDKATQRAQVSSSLEPKDVPFVGWSQAAHAFRIKAATLAPKGILPLLIGDPGVGKRCMARACATSRASVQRYRSSTSIR